MASGQSAGDVCNGLTSPAGQAATHIASQGEIQVGCHIWILFKKDKSRPPRRLITARLQRFEEKNIRSALKDGRLPRSMRAHHSICEGHFRLLMMDRVLFLKTLRTYFAREDCLISTCSRTLQESFKACTDSASISTFHTYIFLIYLEITYFVSDLPLSLVRENCTILLSDTTDLLKFKYKKWKQNHWWRTLLNGRRHTTEMTS